MFPVLALALVGAAATLVALWPYGILLALISAPFGGSTLAALGAAALFVLQSEPAETQSSTPAHADPLAQ